MKFKFLFLLLIASQSVFSQKKTELIESVKLNKTRELTIVLPPSYEFETKKNYPVIYLLDGDYLLDAFNGTLQYGVYFDDLPEVILVGISQAKNGDRFSDTTTDDDGLPKERGAKFYEFIGSELIPFIEKKYRTLPYKVIAGHDLTAGFLNFFLYKDNPIFDAYISLCPELPFEMEYRIPERLSVIKKPISYFQASSSSDSKEIFEGANILDEGIKQIQNEQLSYKYELFEGLSHYSIVPNAIPSALYHVFKGYQPINLEQYQKEVTNLNSGFVKYLNDKYKRINDIYGVEMKVRLIDIMAIQKAILDNNALEELNDLVKLADKNYPKTMLPNYIESVYLENSGKLDGAIKILEGTVNQKEVGLLTKSAILDKLEKLKQARANQYKKE